MLDILGEAALRTLLLATIVQLGLWLLRIRRAQLLLVTWTVVLAASLAMPALQWATPLRLSIGSSHPTAWLSSIADLQQQATPVVSAPPSTADSSKLPAIGFWLIIAYLLVSSLMLLRLTVGVALSFRLLIKAAPLHLDAAQNARIRISQVVSAPVTVGNVILLPPDVVDWPSAMRQAVVAHECAHVARGDFALLVLSQLNRAMFWFSPVSWLLHRRLAALAELASDDHAMRVTGDRTAYAEVLLEMGRRSGPLLRGLAMARASTLHYRIERVLSDSLGVPPVNGLQRSVLVVGAAIISFVAAIPDFDLGASSPSIAIGRIRPALALTDGLVSNPVPVVGALSPPPQLKDAARPVSGPLTARAAAQQSPGVQLAARSMAQSTASIAHPLPPARAPQMRNRASDAPSNEAARARIATVSLPRRTAGAVDEANHSSTADVAGGVRHASSSSREARPPINEPSLLEAIDQQSCDGVYLPGAVGGAGSGNGWGYLNILRARFFREADGRPWLKIYFGTRDPLNLPVEVTGKEVEFTAGNNTSFKMLAQGANHLTGITQRPEGTIDLTCGEAGVHLFDRRS
jgi:beta-lactamase regulating signal transducer with metallopeptidase domain